jgi:hypothetical protein
LLLGKSWQYVLTRLLVAENGRLLALSLEKSLPLGRPSTVDRDSSAGADLAGDEEAVIPRGAERVDALSAEISGGIGPHEEIMELCAGLGCVDTPVGIVTTDYGGACWRSRLAGLVSRLGVRATTRDDE